MNVSNSRIAVAGPSITDREVELVAEAVRTAWYGNHNAYNERFERAFAEYVGTRYAISVPHCTAALHLALAANNIGPGDEVITPDVTWIASVAPVIYVGAQPVFVDILPETWCIDPAAVEAAVSSKTKAIIGVNLYGSMCDWTSLQDIADNHGLVLIEDAAESIGSTYKGRAAGSFGQAAAFSFHGSKTVVTGEGGMLVTDDEALWRRALLLRDHGRDPGDRYFLNSEIGFKYRMSAMQAALGLGQIERIEELVAMKRQIFEWYNDRLEGVDGVTLNAEPYDVRNSYWMVTAVVDPDFGLNKFDIMAALDECNIDSRPFFSPLSSMPAFEQYPLSKRFVTPEAVGAKISETGINLPSGYQMTEELVDTVCRDFTEFLCKCRKN